MPVKRKNPCTALMSRVRILSCRYTNPDVQALLSQASSARMPRPSSLQVLCSHILLRYVAGGAVSERAGIFITVVLSSSSRTFPRSPSRSCVHPWPRTASTVGTFVWPRLHQPQWSDRPLQSLHQSEHRQWTPTVGLFRCLCRAQNLDTSIDSNGLFTHFRQVRTGSFPCLSTTHLTHYPCSMGKLSG